MGTDDYLVLHCQCGCGGVIVDDLSDDYLRNDPDGVMIGFTLWKLGVQGFHWRWRLRHIWHILRYGHPYTDGVILREKDIARLIDFCEKAKERK